MVQMEKAKPLMGRIRIVLKQRRNLAVACALIAGLVLGAAVVGAQRALTVGGVTIEQAAEQEPAEEPGEPGSVAAEDSEEEPDETEGSVGDAPAQVLVDVTGAVASPRVVSLPEGSRVLDAIEAAGGLLPEADGASINQAAVVSDGSQIRVPLKGEVPPASTGVPGAASASPASTPGMGGVASVNLNTASVDELDALPGVGPSTAQAIVSDREEHGRFERIEDLMRVSGIGEKKFEKLRSAICV